MLFYGAGDQAQVLLSILESLSKPCLGVFDDHYSEHSDILPELRLGPYQNTKLPQEELIISIGDNRIRQALAARIQHSFGQIISPSAEIASQVQIGAGTQIMNRACIQSKAKIGKHVIINTGSIVEHHNQVGDFVHIGPGAVLGGRVSVGELSFIGLNASVLPGCRIGKSCIIGAGAVIHQDVADYSVMVGNPARLLRMNHG